MEGRRRGGNKTKIRRKRNETSKVGEREKEEVRRHKKEEVEETGEGVSDGVRDIRNRERGRKWNLTIDGKRMLILE